MRRTLIALGLVAVMFLSLSCERRGADGGGGGEPIKVGVYLDLSGQTSSFGQSTKNGIEMATDEINKAGGINGRQIKLYIEDEQGEPGKVTTVVTKLLRQDQVHAILGEVASTNSLAAAPKAQEAKIPMITPSSTNPKVTQVGDYIFRVCFIDPFQGEVMAKFAANSLKAKRAAILADFNSDYSKGLTQFFKQSFTKLGGTIVDEKTYTQTDRDFSSQLTAIRSTNPDVIYIPGYYGQVGVIAKQARQQGITVPLLGGDGWDAPQLWDLGGEAMNNTFISNHYSIDDPKPEIQKFVADYKARYGGVAPDALAALGYDAMRVLGDALKRAGDTDSTKLRDAIAQTKNFPGVTGTITMNAERNVDKPAAVLELKPAGRQFAYKETIYPDGMTPPTTAGASPAASPAAGTASPAAATQ
ncbi:MAG TPA: ABC transporter substrate-binding protein [Pyrinomonadaceae bacterium]|nr:ABC transporter substrate-binding protein [Pyrinomonadaceae bacterium]